MFNMKNPITVNIFVHAPIEKVWDCFIDPAAIKVWNAASADWHTTEVENDLRVGGRFRFRMEAKDGSEGFDFTGSYTVVTLRECISYTMDDGRKAETTFTAEEDGVQVATRFETEMEHSRDMQKEGWQMILNNFKEYVEHN